MNLEDIHTQYQDNKGYVRAIKLKSNLIIQTSPIIPFLGVGKLKEVIDLPPPKHVDFKSDALISFVKLHSISFTHRSKEGLWFKNPDIHRGFVFVTLTGKEKLAQKLETAPISWIPTQNNGPSRLQTAINNSRMAKHLQNLALYSYSKYGDDWYVKVKGAKYDVEDVSDELPREKNSFWDKKVIVSSKEVLRRLQMHIKTEVFNNKSYVDGFKNRLFLPPVEESAEKKYLTFHSLDDLRKWSLLSGTLKDEFVVKSALMDCFYPKPYFYRKFDKTYLVQSLASGTLRDANGLVDYWKENKINKGYDATFPDGDERDLGNTHKFDLSFELGLVINIAKSGKNTVVGTAELAHAESLSYNITTNPKSWWINFVNYLVKNTTFVVEDMGNVYSQAVEKNASLAVYVALLPI